MPPSGQKRPRWLMSCKCGARVKASRIKSRNCGLDRYFVEAAEMASQNAVETTEPSAVSSSRSRTDLRRHQRRPGQRLALVGAVEQHPPLERVRSHDGKARQDLFPDLREIGRHQDHLLGVP